MDKEWLVFSLNMNSGYSLEYLESLSSEELEKLYFERVENNGKDK